jgi:hypothetical protein
LVDDKYVASAGLIILQDALELVFYSLLIEVGIDEDKSIENQGFDQLIGDLRKRGYNIPKSGTLKALNKQRVIIKHYGQLSEPDTVKNYFKTARVSTNKLLEQIFKKSLQDIMLDEVIKNEEVKAHIRASIREIAEGNFFDALVDIRKAIFLEVEQSYSIEAWEDFSPNKRPTLSDLLGRGPAGLNAPYYTKNKEWIEENVLVPFDYLQLDTEKIKIDLIEWGVSTQDFRNLTTLTPRVYRFNKTEQWVVEERSDFVEKISTENNARFCLDRAVALIIKKQNHFDLRRHIKNVRSKNFVVKMIVNQDVYKRASFESAIVGKLNKGMICTSESEVVGLDGKNKFRYILHKESEKQFIFGFIPIGSCEISDLTSDE